MHTYLWIAVFQRTAYRTETRDPLKIVDVISNEILVLCLRKIGHVKKHHRIKNLIVRYVKRIFAVHRHCVEVFR